MYIYIIYIVRYWKCTMDNSHRYNMILLDLLIITKGNGAIWVLSNIHCIILYNSHIIIYR